MSHLLTILRLAWPYLRKYRLRLIVAVLAGIFFAISNASFLFAVKMTIERVLPPDQIRVVPAVTTPVATSPAIPWLQPMQETLGQWQQWAQQQGAAWADAWLPKRGQPVHWQQIIGVLGFFAFFAGFRSLCSYLSNYCMTWVSAHFITDLRADLLSKLYSLSLDFYQRSTVGDLTNRLVADTASLYSSISAVFADLVKEPATVIAILIASAFIDWHLTLFAMVILPLCIVPVVVLGNKVRRAVRRTVDASVAQSNLMIESLSGIRVVKAYHLESKTIERFREHADRIVHNNVKQAQAEGLINPSIEIVSSLAFGLLIIYVVADNVSLPNMFSVLMGVILFFAPLRRLGRVHVVLQSGSVSAQRLQTILQEKPTVCDPIAPQPIHTFQDTLTCENLGFKYGERQVLHEINLKIAKGTSLGIAGESGSGKSTLVNLLLRFYDPTQGRILMDGRDLRAMAHADLLSLTALVSQEIIIFNGTISENISCGKAQATREEIVQAARHAHAHDFISALPQGYDTPVGERGVSLSGGQRQRLAIARAFIRNAPILILDEATASLDSASEAEVQSAIDELAENRTVITIAHRLSTLQGCDRVIVLDQGRIIEEDTYEALLKKGGTFTAMAARQGITAT